MRSVRYTSIPNNEFHKYLERKDKDADFGYVKRVMNIQQGAE